MRAVASNTRGRPVGLDRDLGIGRKAASEPGEPRARKCEGAPSSTTAGTVSSRAWSSTLAEIFTLAPSVIRWTASSAWFFLTRRSSPSSVASASAFAKAPAVTMNSMAKPP